MDRVTIPTHGIVRMKGENIRRVPSLWKVLTRYLLLCHDVVIVDYCVLLKDRRSSQRSFTTKGAFKQGSAG